MTGSNFPIHRPIVNSVVQAVSILRHLGTLPEGAGVNAVARAIGIGPSSCFNVLRTLVATDLLSFNPATKRYSLGFGTIDLARMVLGGDALVAAARGPMTLLAETHDAAVGLWRVTGARLVLVAIAESDAATRIHLVVGQRQLASAGAVGRALLATRNLPARVIEQAYEDVRWHRPPGLEIFVRQVAQAAACGWATDLGNSNHGIATAAAAIREPQVAVRFVLSASIFNGREDAAGMERIGRDLRDTAGRLAPKAYHAPQSEPPQG